MKMLLDVAWVVAGAAALWFGAGWIVSAATRIARRLGIGELIVGLTIVAFGTSAPELAVTVGAALEGRSDISVANVVGSNIFNLGFILGGVALLSAIRTSRVLVVRDGGMLIGATMLLLWLMRDLTLSRADGLVLMAALVAYLLLLWRSGEAPVADEELDDEPYTWRDLPRLALGLALVLGGGKLLVDGGVGLAQDFGVSEWVIGVTIVAMGTSAPELATSMTAALRGKHGLTAGNLIGSDLFNMLAVLGVASALRPLSVNAAARVDLWVLLAMVLVVVAVMRHGWRISRADGALLLLLASGRWALTLLP